MKTLKGKVAAVSGAGSGIGRALARELAMAGCHVSLSDIDEQSVIETAHTLGSLEVNATTHRVDVSDADQVQAWAQKTVESHGAVDIVINNAGAGMSIPLKNSSLDDLHWIMNINFWGVVHGSMAFLPFLEQREEAALCNVASVFSLFTYPGAGGYCASKAAVRAYTQTLAQELADSSVDVCCVYPGGVKTGIARNSRLHAGATEKEKRANEKEFEETHARTTPEQAARAIVAGIRRGKPRILVGSDAKIFEFASRAMPETWQKLARLAQSR